MYESISRLLVVSKRLLWPIVYVILICLCSEVGNTSELAAWISENILFLLALEKGVPASDLRLLLKACCWLRESLLVVMVA